MTNAEKLKTAEERAKAFKKFCIGKNCCSCELSTNVQVTNVQVTVADCAFRWLDLEAEDEKPLPCPFCGGATHVYDYRKVGHCVKFICDKCCMELALNFDMCDSVERYNRVARAVMDAKESEGK